MRIGYVPERIRRQIRAVRIERMFRVIHRRRYDLPLDAVPAPSRFSDPDGNYAVLYAAEAVRCCFWEAVVRNRLTHRQHRELPRADIDARLVVSLESREDLALVDLRGDGPIQIGAPSAVAHDSNHAAAPFTVYGHLCPCSRSRMDSCFSRGLRGICVPLSLIGRSAN